MALMLAALLIAAPGEPQPSLRPQLILPDGCENTVQGKAYILNYEQKEQITDSDLKAVEKCFKAWLQYITADARAEAIEAERKLWIGTDDLGKCQPNSVDAALTCMDEHFSQEAKHVISTEAGRTSQHFGIAVFLRNSWILGGGSALSNALKNIGFNHADDMSTVLLEAFAARQQRQPYDFKSKAKEYEAYWAKYAEDKK